MNEWKDLMNNFFAMKPKKVNGLLNSSSKYYRRYLLRKLFTIFEIDNIPENWDKDYLLSHLFLDGVICVTDTSLGVIPLQTGYSGINVYEHPTECVIANPILGGLRRTIGTDCVLIKLQWDYSSVNDILDRYAYRLAACDSSIDVNLMNTKVAFIGYARNKTESDTIKKIYDEISEGNPLVITDSDIIRKGDSFQLFKPKDSYIAGDVQELKRTILNEFLTEIGINNANILKRERLNSDEVNITDEEQESNIDHWFDNLKEGFDEVNKMFDLNIKVAKRYGKREVESGDTE